MSKELKLCEVCGEWTTYKLDGRPMCLQCVEDITGVRQAEEKTEQLHEALLMYIEKRERDLTKRVEYDASYIDRMIRHPDRWGSIMDAARRNRECMMRLDELAMLRAVFGLEVKDE